MMIMRKMITHQVDIQLDTALADDISGCLDDYCQTILNQVFEEPICVSLTISNEDTIQKLNNDYRNKNKPTNVLSFADTWPDAIVEEKGYYFIGDIIICPAVVEREAEAQFKTLADHWKHMVVHSILHLAGYDHIDDSDAQKMEQLEVNILGTMKVSNPYREHE